MLENYLLQVGLNKKESKVYLANLQLGPSNISDIADRSEVKRTTVYDVMKSLTAKNLVSVTGKGKKKIFIAAEPEEIRKMLLRKFEVFTDILPQLKSFSKTARKRPTIQVFEGEDGLFSIYEDILKDREQLCSIVAFSEATNKILDRMAREFVTGRVKYNIFAKVIAPDSKTALEWHQIDEESLREMRLIDKDKYPFSIEISIYGNKTAFISFKENELFGVIVKSPEITNTMQLMFDFFWTTLGNEK